jgi:hypothetical protein
MKLSEARRGELLQKLATYQGFASVDMLVEASLDAVSPAICTDCELTCETEPDQRHGHCESCGQNTVVAAPIFADLV